VGSKGIKHRKRSRHLPKVHTELPTGEPSPWTPMGVVGAYGKIFRASESANRQQRRAGTILSLVIVVPSALLLIVAVIGLATH
jgi:hypothetical protein